MDRLVGLKRSRILLGGKDIENDNDRSLRRAAMSAINFTMFLMLHSMRFRQR